MEAIKQSSNKPDETVHRSLTSLFIQPARCQSTSRLFQLPAEVRSIIFRELLYSAKPLHNASAMEESDLFQASRGRRRPVRRGFIFHTNILPTCQQIYHEAYHVLYKENTLSIYVSLQGITQVTILDRRIRLWPYSAHTFQDAFDELERDENQNELMYTATLPSIPQLLQKMDKFQLTIIAYEKVRTQVLDRTLYDFCHFVRKALYGKAIDVRLVQPWLPDCLCAFSILRCQAFTIRSWGLDGDNRFRWTEQDHSFCQTITSSQPIHDTVEAYDALTLYLERFGHGATRRSIWDARKKLYQQAFLFDANSFSSALEALLILLEEQYERMVKLEENFAWQRESLDKLWQFTAFS